MEHTTFPFGDFLAFLKHQGFSIGIDHYLRLQTLLNFLGPDCGPDDLKFLLCPIFAVNEKQQRQFHNAFDRYFEPLTLSTRKPPAGARREEEEVPKLEEPPVFKWRWPHLLLVLILLVLAAFLVIKKPQKQQKTVEPQGYQIVPDSPISIDWTHFRYVVIAAPFIIFLVTEIRRREKRRLTLERQRGKKPPFVWRIKCELPELGFLRGESFYAAMRRLKRRLTSDVFQLDIDATINRTVQAGGFPSYRYRALTKPPEYFVLVDLPAARDHYARLVDHIVNAMRFEGIFVTRYFYDRDPRVCFNDYLTERVYLDDLKNRFNNCRLIVFGECEEFLDPVTGELERWVSLLHTWPDRVVLTPLPPDQWGWREATLSEEFLILPATVDGLAALGEHLSGFSVAELTNWPTTGGKTWDIASDAAEDVSFLRSRLGKDVFQWLCACAVFPQLHYELTLFLGGLPCMPAGLLNEENLYSLFRLPWFRSGSIPDEVRFRLLNQIDQDKSQAIRSAVIKVLEDNPPPEGTFARNTWSMNIVLQQWMLSPKERRHLKEVSQLPDSVGEKTVVEDYTALQLIESEFTSPLKIIIPRRLYKILFRNGLPLFGFGTIGRAFIAALVTSIIYGFTVWPVVILPLTASILLLSALYLLWKAFRWSFSRGWQAADKVLKALKALWRSPSYSETSVPEQKLSPTNALSGVKHPTKAWVVVFAGFAVNLCLGILYAWSVWSKQLISLPKAGQLITEGPAAGWYYITNAEAATPFALCVIVFALLMIPGGRIQDKFGPKVGAITGGLFLALGCIVAGLMKSYSGLVFGFGILGGIGMGIGYAAPTPAALSWFGPHKRGLVAGLVVGGYGGAALYISPLAAYLISSGGVSYSLIFLGIFFAVVVIFAGSLLAKAPAGYMAPAAPVKAGVAPAKAAGTTIDWNPSEIIKAWQFYALVIMFIGTTQSGLMIIANATVILFTAAKGIAFFAGNAWIFASYGGLINALGRVGTGFYSDKIGRANAYTLNCLVSALCLFLLPVIIAAQSVGWLFLAVGLAYWQYGGGLALMPAYTADFFGPKNLGMNYGLVFMGWGLGFFMTRLAGTIKDITGSLDFAFYISGITLIISVLICRATKRPRLKYENGAIKK